jgi:hypothetical protein
MKKLALALVLAVAISGCSGLNVTGVPSVPCTIYQDFGATPENSLIAAKIADPCQAQRLLVTAARVPIIWAKADYYQKFGAWADRIQMMINSGISYSDLQIQVVKAVAEYNAEAGMALLIVSDSLFVFNGELLVLKDMDKRLLLASLNDVRVKVANMGLAYSGVVK